MHTLAVASKLSPLQVNFAMASCVHQLFLGVVIALFYISYEFDFSKHFAKAVFLFPFTPEMGVTHFYWKHVI